jgi:hypothetical protein
LSSAFPAFFIITFERHIMTHRLSVFLSALALVLFLSSGRSPAQLHPAHEHGAARLNVVAEEGGFVADLESPLASFISFEHEPSTPEQRAEVADMVAKLARADEVFQTDAAAGCRLESLALSSANIPADLLGEYASKEPAGRGHDGGEAGHDHDGEEAGHDHDGEEAGRDHDHDGEVHGDLDAEYVFACSDGAKLAGLKVGLFELFPNLEEVEVQVAGAGGQSAAELTASSPELKW